MALERRGHRIVNDFLSCPRCRAALDAAHACPKCRGVAVNVAVLRQFAPADRVKRLWAALDEGAPGDPCPSCARPLLVVPPYGERGVAIDVCRRCQLLWFDADKLAAFSPERQKPAPRTHELSPRAVEAIVKAEISGQILGNEAERDAERVATVLRALGEFLATRGSR